jgi:hypothetical protein
MHLPLIDFRPYKVGNNILEKMELPEDAQKPVSEYSWKFRRNGEEIIIKNEGEYPQVEGEFVGVETRQIKEGDKPAIKDFVIEKDGEDLTREILSEPKLLMIVAYSLRSTEKEGYPAVKRLSEEALEKGYRVVGLTSSGEDMQERIKETYSLNFEFYQSDETVLKTIVRANPGILVLRNGTVFQKKHWFDASEIKLQD